MILWDLFITFISIGLFSFGGGYAILPAIESAAMNHQWISQALFNYDLGIANITPGPVSTKMVTFIGLEQGGVLGGLVATLAFILPGLIITYGIIKLWDVYKEKAWFKAVNHYLIAVIAALFVQTAYLLFMGVPFKWGAIVIVVLVFFLGLSNRISSIYLLLGGGLLGLLLL